MSTQTTNYGLVKPDYNETADIIVINQNMDILDTKLKAVETAASAPPGNNSITDDMIGTRTPDQTQAPTSPGTGKIVQLVSWLANRIRVITGKANWWDAPVKSIQQLADDQATHLAEDVTDVGGVHGLQIEHGTFTPKLTTFGGELTDVTYAEQTGSYTKIGKTVFFNVKVVTSSWSHNFINELIALDSFPFPLKTSSPNQKIALSGYVAPFTKTDYTQVIPCIEVGMYNYGVVFHMVGPGKMQEWLHAKDVPSGTNITVQAYGSYLTN